MWREFREFLLKQNALALAVGVIIGAAAGRVVTSLVSDLLMPVISIAMPHGDWQAAKIVLPADALPKVRAAIAAEPIPLNAKPSKGRPSSPAASHSDTACCPHSSAVVASPKNCARKTAWVSPLT